jgi:hypothetical protein
MKIITLFLVVVSLGLSSCEKESATPAPSPDKLATQIQKSNIDNTKVVAKVNGRPIYEDDLGRITLKDAIADEILYERGLKQGLDQKFEKQIEDFKKRLILDEMQKELSYTIPKQNVSSEEIEKYYNENKTHYIYLRVKQIMVDNKKVAEEIYKKLKEGEDIDKIKSDYGSKNEAKVLVSDINVGKTYNSYFDNYSLNSVSEIIPYGNDYKILKILEVKVVPLSNVRVQASIRSTLQAQKENQIVQDLAQKIKTEDNVKVEIINKDFLR